VRAVSAGISAGQGPTENPGLVPHRHSPVLRTREIPRGIPDRRAVRTFRPPPLLSSPAVTAEGMASWTDAGRERDGDDPLPPLTALIKDLKDDDADVRHSAAEALVDIHDPAANALSPDPSKGER